LVAKEVVAALAATDKDVSIGGAGLAAAAIELGLVGELRMFRVPVVVGGACRSCRRSSPWPPFCVHMVEAVDGRLMSRG
jgi:riboflavin biosynthesis pyrimidine reductase